MDRRCPHTRRLGLDGGRLRRHKPGRQRRRNDRRFGGFLRRRKRRGRRHCSVLGRCGLRLHCLRRRRRRFDFGGRSLDLSSQRLRRLSGFGFATIWRGLRKRWLPRYSSPARQAYLPPAVRVRVRRLMQRTVAPLGQRTTAAQMVAQMAAWMRVVRLASIAAPQTALAGA